MTLIRLPSLDISAWSEESLQNLIANRINTVPRPLILIDGIGGSGKTSLAEQLTSMLNANLVHTDDVSWGSDPIHWEDEMLDAIVNPWLNGKTVDYKPTGWIKENRPGSICVDPDKALVIEGMGAGRKSLRSKATYSIWVETEYELARERVVQRDLSNGENGATIESVNEFADWWDSLLLPLFLEETPWKYADVIVSGSQSDLNYDNLKIYVQK